MAITANVVGGLSTTLSSYFSRIMSVEDVETYIFISYEVNKYLVDFLYSENIIKKINSRYFAANSYEELKAELEYSLRRLI
jgi:hypothetical protein